MSTWLICDKWDLQMDVPQAPPTKGHRPFHEFPVESMSRRAICREALFGRLPKIDSVVELFGGLGITATILENTQTLRQHDVTEIDPTLVEHLKRNGFTAGVADAFEQVNHIRPERDLVDCDFGLFTMAQWERKPEVRAFTDTLFSQDHRFVSFTDESVARMGLHRGIYTRIFGTPINTIDDYVRAWSWRWHDLYDYSIVAAERHHRATYTLWQRSVPPSDLIPNKTTALYPGVRLA